MRDSNKTHVLRTADGVPYGVFAEADFCAEHEEGLRNLHSFMGCGSEDVEGIGRYMPSASRVELGGFVEISTGKFWTRVNGRKKTSTRMVLCSRADLGYRGDGFYLNDDTQVAAQFSSRDFRVMSKDEEADALLQKIHDHARMGDIVVMMGGLSGNPFNRGGLLIAIASMISDEDKETVRASHENTRLLAEAALATGIKERIDARAAKEPGFNSPYRLYALSPNWKKVIKTRAHDGSTMETAHDVIFFINNGRKIHGWYTVEELDEWLDGKGKVVEDYEAYLERERRRAAA